MMRIVPHTMYQLQTVSMEVLLKTFESVYEKTNKLGFRPEKMGRGLKFWI